MPSGFLLVFIFMPMWHQTDLMKNKKSEKQAFKCILSQLSYTKLLFFKIIDKIQNEMNKKTEKEKTNATQNPNKYTFYTYKY